MTIGTQEEFEVMAQHRRGDPVQLIGSVWAPSSGLAAFYAAATYDEQRWHRLFAIRRTHEIPVIVEGSLVITKGEVEPCSPHRQP